MAIFANMTPKIEPSSLLTCVASGSYSFVVPKISVRLLIYPCGGLFFPFKNDPLN